MADLTVSFFLKKVNIRGTDGWDEVGIGGKRLVTASGRDRGLGGIRVALKVEEDEEEENPNRNESTNRNTKGDRLGFPRIRVLINNRKTNCGKDERGCG